MALDSEKWRLTEAEHQSIFDELIRPVIALGAEPQAEPVAIILGGQPGAGKSALVDAAVKELASNGGSVQIIGDDLRDRHPAYGRLMQEDDKTAAFYTGSDSGRWVEKSIAYAKEYRLNLVIEGTMRDPEVVAATMTSLREAGYKIEARVIAVDFRLSELGILQRYEGQKADRGVARMTTPEAHQAAYDGLPVALDRIESGKLADRIRIYQRGNVLLHENELKAGEWITPPHARDVVETERARPMTPNEAQAYIQGYDRLLSAIKRPERQATSEEIKRVETLRQAASASVVPTASAAESYWNRVAERGQDATKGMLNEQTLGEAPQRGPRLK